MTEKLVINQAVVVEGRDDEELIRRVALCTIIKTHGYGINSSTWRILEKAYKEKGLIIFTDPDRAGELIRERLLRKFPNSINAYLIRNKAVAKGKKGVGIENAKEEAVKDALIKALQKFNQGSEINGEKSINALKQKSERSLQKDDLTPEDMMEMGLLGKPTSKLLREKVGDELGIGYVNGKGFLRRLKDFNISRKEVVEAIEKAAGNKK